MAAGRGEPLVMGVLNVTPDSFSDGGRWADLDAAVAHGRRLVAEGADLVDVGGESTRPGAEPVSEAEERERVVPVVEAAIAAGATLVNDVSASLAEVVAAAGRGVGFAAMHMAGEPQTMQADPRYDDVVAEVHDFLVRRASAAHDLGIEEVWIDPGIGFGKTSLHNLQLLAHLEVLVSSGFPVLVGTSRKRFLGVLAARADGAEPGSATGTDDRLAGSVATAAWAMWHGAGMVRAHDVRPTVLTRRRVMEAMQTH